MPRSTCLIQHLISPSPQYTPLEFISHSVVCDATTTMKSTAAFATLMAGASAMPYIRRQASYGNGSAPVTNPAVWADLRGKIKHIVYLMEENHSFDNIAGYWDFHPDIDNLRNIDYCNDYTNPNWTVWGEPLKICAGPYETEVPLTDPGMYPDVGICRRHSLTCSRP